MLNNIILQGRLTGDVRFTELPSGEISNFRLACNDRRSELTLFINVVCFKGLAKLVKEYVGKGDEVLVSGKLQFKEKDGKEYYEVLAQEVEFIKLGEKSPHDFM